MNISFTIPGKGVPQPRPKFYRGRIIFDHSPRLVEWKKIVVSKARDAGAYPTLEKVGVDVVFKRSDKKKWDLDNALKSLLDALNNVAWKDDSLVTTIRAAKVESLVDGTIVSIKTLDA